MSDGSPSKKPPVTWSCHSVLEQLSEASASEKSPLERVDLRAFNRGRTDSRTEPA